MNDLADRINAHLEGGGVIRVATYARCTYYEPNHAGWFSAGDPRDGGVWVRSGRKRVYVMPEYVAFGHYEATASGA